MNAAARRRGVPAPMEAVAHGDILSGAELRALTGVDAGRADDLSRRGLFPRARRIGVSRHVFARADVMGWLAEKKVRDEAAPA